MKQNYKRNQRSHHFHFVRYFVTTFLSPHPPKINYYIKIQLHSDSKQILNEWLVVTESSFFRLDIKRTRFSRALNSVFLVSFRLDSLFLCKERNSWASCHCRQRGTFSGIPLKVSRLSPLQVRRDAPRNSGEVGPSQNCFLGNQP